MTDSDLDLNQIEQAARDSLAFGGDRRVTQYCLDLVAEVRRLCSLLTRRESTVLLRCPTCDCEIEVDPIEAFGLPDMPLTKCPECLHEIMVSRPPDPPGKSKSC